MNDRYLFKGKRTDNGEWVEGYLIPRYYEGTDEMFEAHIVADAYEQMCVLNMERALVSEVGRECFKVDISTICQCTGLRDENGNLIWENDVAYIESEEEYFVIKWSDDIAMFIVEGETLSCDFDNYNGNELEVMGNIFNNPELPEV